MTTIFRTRLVLAPVLCVLMWGCAESKRAYPAHDSPMAVPSGVKETASLGTPWENEFGLVQGAKAWGVVFLSGQLSLDEKGMVVGKGSMEAQLRQAYANVGRALQQFNLTMNDVLEETLYVTDMPVALTTGPKVRREIYVTEHPAVASTLVQVQRLAFADALVEIRVVAKAPPVAPPQSDASPRRRGGRGGMGRGGSGISS